MNWIDVTKKKPNELEDVLIAEFDQFGCNYGAVKGFIRDGVFFCTPDGLDAYNYDGGASIVLDMDVTHWMPLPAQPSND